MKYAIFLALGLLVCANADAARCRNGSCASGDAKRPAVQSDKLTFDGQTYLIPSPKKAGAVCKNPNCQCDPCICGPQCDCGYRAEPRRRVFRLRGRR